MVSKLFLAGCAATQFDVISVGVVLQVCFVEIIEFLSIIQYTSGIIDGGSTILS